jgi:hypothetical protein
MGLSVSESGFFVISPSDKAKVGPSVSLPDSSAIAARDENQKPDVGEMTGVGFLVCHDRWAAPASGFFHHRVCESTKVRGGS